MKQRELGFIKFNLVDTREWMEWVGARIKGVDYLVPTTSFYSSIEPLNTQKRYLSLFIVIVVVGVLIVKE